MAGFRIRSGGTDDVVALLEFWSQAGENEARPDDDAELVEKLLRHDPGSILVAEIEGNIAGSVIAGWDGWRAHLYRLAVDPALRGLGIGRSLVQAAEDRLRDLGAIRFDAMVLSGNTLGEGAWEAMRYRPQENWTRWVRFP
ncbi:MAG: GNAT family N-acetyltransferase [Actinobacteria bacterium]|nr:GNAT family N-acetyltransferase [Actinomycetota bacterium]